jgi:hypothetical protein
MRYYITLFIVCLLLISGCAKERAQAAADARAGLRALAAAYEAGAATADVIAIIKGIDKYLPAASGVNSAEWPEPTMTPEQIRSDPIAYGEAAPPEPETWSTAAILSGAGLLLLTLLRVAAPAIPGAGPVVQGAANLAWSLMATHKQKQADQIAETVAQAAQTAKPLLDELRAVPLADLPPSLRNLAQSPFIAAAIKHLSEPPKKA